jgi:Legionella pneumophila major outer membrane protein precursor
LLCLVPCFLLAESPILSLTKDRENICWEDQFDPALGPRRVKAESAEPESQTEEAEHRIDEPPCKEDRFDPALGPQRISPARIVPVGKPKEAARLIDEHPGDGFKTDFTFLIWQAQEDGLEFAAINRPELPLSPTIPTDISATLSTVDFAWEPAFKFLFGYHFEDSSWDLNARWTGYYSRSHRALSESLSPSGAGLLPLWIPPQAAIALFPVYAAAQGTLLLRMNNIDLELAYAGGVSPFFFLKVHGGLKLISLHQIFRVHYSGGFFDGVNQMLDSNSRSKSRGVGLGPRFGFGSRWVLPQGWSLMAEAAGALALDDITTRRKDASIGRVAGAPQQISIRFHENFWVWRPLLEGKAGVQWEYAFGCKKNRILDLEAAYEIQQYWEQNFFTRYADSAIFYAPYNNRGNLTLQGFSFTIALRI